MMRRLPPLNALKAFEASARLKSFQAAGQELHVTQSAISHQIRQLENHLGVKLFRRLPNSIELTSQAEHLLPVMTNALDDIARASSEVRSKQATIVVHCSTSFALRWLLQRVGGFERDHPDIAVRLSSWSPSVESEGSRCDLEVVYVHSPPLRSEYAHRLMDEWLLPVCSPDYLSSARLTATELLRHRLLVNAPDHWDWKCWGRDAGVDIKAMEEALSRGIVFDADAAAIETALAGQGIALANLCYIHSELESGALVPAVTLGAFKLGAHYILERRKSTFASKTFSRWIIDRAAVGAKDALSAFEATGDAV